jgi:hypothetical protein
MEINLESYYVDQKKLINASDIEGLAMAFPN